MKYLPIILVAMLAAVPSPAAVNAIYVNGVYMGCEFTGGSRLLHLEKKETDVTYSPTRVSAYACITFNGGTPVNRLVYRPWGVGWSAGVFVEGLTNSRYTLLPVDTAAGEQYRVYEDRRARDPFTPGVATMVHLRRVGPSLQFAEWIPLSAGVGVADRGGLRLVGGTSLLFGRRIVATAGLSLGQVDRLPLGVAVGDLTRDPDALHERPRRYDTSWMFGLTYRFGTEPIPMQAPAAPGPDIGRGGQGDPCAATAAAAIARLGNPVSVLFTLRRLRRDVLTQSVAGRELTGLYYRHTRRVVWLFARDRELHRQAGDFLAAAMPVAGAMVNGEQAILTNDAVATSERFFRALAAADRRYGGTQLATDVEIKLRQLQPATLAGIEAAAALRRLDGSA
jgi:hypothetical protein